MHICTESEVLRQYVFQCLSKFATLGMLPVHQEKLKNNMKLIVWAFLRGRKMGLFELPGASQTLQFTMFFNMLL